MRKHLAIAAILFALLARRKAPTSGGVPQMKATFANAWRDRCVHLMQRARSGAVWSSRMAKLLGSEAAGAAAARWIGMESGGNPRVVSPLKERGLAQLAPVSIADLGFTNAEYEAMIDPKTSDDKHAEFAARVIWMEIVKSTKSAGTPAPAPGWGPPIGPSSLTSGVVSANGLAFGKIRHALPLLLREMKEQGHIRASIESTMRSMMTGGTSIEASGNAGVRVPPFKPSARLAAFAKGGHAVTGNVTHDLIVRFLAPVAVIAHAERSFDFALVAVS